MLLLVFVCCLIGVWEDGCESRCGVPAVVTVLPELRLQKEKQSSFCRSYAICLIANAFGFACTLRQQRCHSPLFCLSCKRRFSRPPPSVGLGRCSGVISRGSGASCQPRPRGQSGARLGLREETSHTPTSSSSQRRKRLAAMKALGGAAQPLLLAKSLGKADG